MTGECDCCGFRVRLRIVQPSGRCLCKLCDRAGDFAGMSNAPPSTTSLTLQEMAASAERLHRALRAKIEAPRRGPHLEWRHPDEDP